MPKSALQQCQLPPGILPLNAVCQRGPDRDYLEAFVSTKPRLQWIYELDEGRLQSSGEHLNTLATDAVKVPSLHERKVLVFRRPYAAVPVFLSFFCQVLCGLTKLIKLAAGEPAHILKCLFFLGACGQERLLTIGVCSIGSQHRIDESAGNARAGRRGILLGHLRQF
jgi:hypothetical protein